MEIRYFLWIGIMTTMVMSGKNSPPELRRFSTYSFSKEMNKTLEISNLTYSISEGSLTWPKYPNIQPKFVVLNSFISSDDIAAIMELIQDDPALMFDEDPDSVDDQATHEIYIQRNGKIEGVREIEGKLDQFSSVYNQRLPFREKFNKIIQPIINEKILPFVNHHYAQSCSLSGQQCYVCHSLVRRYQSEERMTHPAHFDTHALVTGIIALNSYGRDYNGGLYVSVGAPTTRMGNTSVDTEIQTEKYIGLQAGDVLLHQSNLLHGVRVESGTRWSWIIWIKDTKTCIENNLHWTTPQAISGDDPVVQYIHSKRSTLSEKIYWLKQSSQLGFTLAANELGSMYSLGNNEIQINITEAKRLLHLANDVPEAYFNLGMIALNEKEIFQAVQYFKQAVYLGELSKAAQNVGVAYYHGRSVERDLLAAVEWWERAGNGDSLMKAAQTLLLKDPSLPLVNISHVLYLFRRSANAGHAPAAAYLGRYYDQLGQQGEAIHWFMKAARHGDQQSRDSLQRIQDQLHFQQQQALEEELEEEGDQDEEREREVKEEPEL